MSEQEWLAQRERLKAEVLQELRTELVLEPSSAAPNTAAVTGSPSPLETASSSATAAQLDPALAAHVNAALERLLQERHVSSPAGTVQGQLLHGTAGLADARVRLVRMEAFRSKRSEDYRTNEYYETRTDMDGQYAFPLVEPGKYKLLWVPPGGDYWIRFIADRPDVVVKANRATVVRTIDTNRRILGE